MRWGKTVYVTLDSMHNPQLNLHHLSLVVVAIVLVATALILFTIDLSNMPKEVTKPGSAFAVGTASFPWTRRDARGRGRKSSRHSTQATRNGVPKLLLALLVKEGAVIFRWEILRRLPVFWGARS